MFKIRRMAGKDRGSVVRLLNAHFPHVGMTDEKLLDRVVAGSRFFVAEQDSIVSGFCELRIGKAALLRGIAVRTGMRAKGIGTALVERAVSETVKGGLGSLWTRVDALNEKAVRFYEALGFSVKKETVGRVGEKLYLMRKDLET